MPCVPWTEKTLLWKRAAFLDIKIYCYVLPQMFYLQFQPVIEAFKKLKQEQSKNMWVNIRSWAHDKDRSIIHLDPSMKMGSTSIAHARNGDDNSYSK